MPIDMHLAGELRNDIDRQQEALSTQLPSQRKEISAKTFKELVGLSYRQLQNTSTLHGFPDYRADKINRRMMMAREKLRSSER